MAEIKLDVQLRNKVGTRKIKSLRRDMFVPAVVYGDEQKPASIQVERRQYEKIMRQHKGENVLFRLNIIDDAKKGKDYSAIVREEQHHPVTEELLHIDFNRISLTKEIEVKVQIVVHGDAPGVKRDGGSIEHHLWELDIVCLPTQIPQKIDVDVSHMEIGSNIFVKDLALPKGVRTKHDLQGVVLTLIPPMKEEQLQAQADEAAAITEPEVLKEKKKPVEEGKAEEGKEGKEAKEGKEKKG